MSLASSSTSSAVPAPRADAAPRARGIVGLYADLTKARLSALVLLTTLVGFVLGAVGATWTVTGLLFTLLGTALAAGAASAFNQVLEVDRDGRMPRTQGRPLPSGAMTLRHALIAAFVMTILGVGLLAAFVNLAAAGLAALTIALYVLVYTPLKTRSSLNTLIGAVCGAIPPMIGWTAATGGLDVGAWWLGGILFVWQLPHFLALAWMYRDDYERGGFVMLPAVDPTGRLCGQVSVLTSLVLVPLAAGGTLLGIVGWTYFVVALALGVLMSVLAVSMFRHRTRSSARRLFLASITYLPILLLAMVLDRGPVNQESLGLFVAAPGVESVPGPAANRR